jgi:hypothetical protein
LAFLLCLSGILVSLSFRLSRRSRLTFLLLVLFGFARLALLG